MRTLNHLLAALPLAAMAAAQGASQAVPDALAQPATITAKSGAAAMLAVARAGKRLVAAGERGTVLYSDDAGKSWRQAAVPVSVSLTALRFVDGKVGWAVGHQGVVLHTTDGGATWSKQLDGIQAAALVLREAESAFGPERDKAVAEARRLVDDGPDKPFLDLHFDSPTTGYVLGAYNMMFRTTDGGASWQPWQSRVANPKGLHLYGMRGTADAIYLAGEQGLLLRSTDQGASFSALPTPYKGSYFGLLAGRGGALLAYGLRGNAFRSTDRGASWSQVATGVQTSLAAGTVMADGSMVLVSQGGDVLVSRDDGRTFATQAATALPLAAVTQAGDGALVVAGLRGLRRVP
ncbi:MAG TPA: YCF48-related protein [Duganella sp.]|uniref:WD40/YVTN/BNR-like repeat-containing protein n=1 Tax=Duganella sp. TaxID=1904440 RepID=UPI002ED1FDDF